MFRLAALFAGVGLGGLAASPGPAQSPLPTPQNSAAVYGAKLQRAMTLLHTSSGRKRNTVRVLFYGQSITEQAWTREVAEDLRRRFPITDLVIENRAIGGFTAPRLVKTAEADLYPFYPDLVIFHVYGTGPDYEAIIRRLRERTTADVLMATDHVAPLIGESVDEETDTAKLTPAHGAPWRNRVYLPEIARRYDVELADVRPLWKQYLREHKLSASALLSDDLHLNDHGCHVMADIIKPHLRYRPDLSDESWRDRVQTYEVGTDIHWKNGKLVLPFAGNRVDLICKEISERSAPAAAVRIDGKKPSEFPELYGPTRAEVTVPRCRIPALMQVRSAAPLLVEDWTLHVWAANPGRTLWKFKLHGSVTGDDGDGTTAERFVSRSGRVVLEPEDFNIDDAVLRSGQKTLSAFIVTWRVEPRFADRFAVPERANPFGETVITAAQGLTNGHHVLELFGGPDVPLAAVRVYRPPLGRE